jgi:hypothetical protein
MGRISQDKSVSSAGRFYGAHTIIHDNVKYMTRLWVWRLRFHIFHRGDHNHDCHDHPWGFWTFPLRSYVEDVLQVQRDTIPVSKDAPPAHYFTSRQVVKAFRFHYRPATHAHRVLGRWTGKTTHYNSPTYTTGAIPTFVWRDKPTRAWGFTKNRDGKWCWVPWKEYVLEGGRDVPCS